MIDGVKLKPSLCPRCGYMTDMASHPTDPTARPKDGDFSVCLSCGGLLMFNEDLTLREVSKADFELLSPQHKQILEDIERARKKVIGLTPLTQQRRKTNIGNA